VRGHLVLDAEVVATTATHPANISALGNIVGVLDGERGHVTQFAVDDDGNLLIFLVEQ
jgi:hypothetical protein